MYWLMADSVTAVFLWVITAGMWSIGGWLIVRSLFRLDPNENIFIGFSSGIIFFIWEVNLLGRIMPVKIAMILSAALLLLVGVYLLIKDRSYSSLLLDLRAWPQIIAFLVLLYVFTIFGRGVTLFDEPKNLSLISLIAAGDIPPHFYMNVDFLMLYHYGFHILGASLVTLGGFFPWSAFDFGKAIFGAYSVILVYLLANRYLKNTIKSILAPVVLLFATGTRYLLFLLPDAFFKIADKQIFPRRDIDAAFIPFSEFLSHKYVATPNMAVPYIYGFLNGIWAYSYMIYIQAGSYAVHLTVLFVLWMLIGRSDSKWSIAFYAVLLSVWALAWESSYFIIIAGAGILIVVEWIKNKKIPINNQFFLAAVLSGFIAMFQGGTITEILRKLLFSAGVVAAQGYTEYPISVGFIWPPVIFSSGMGDLVLSSPVQLIVAIFELGPIIFFSVYITKIAWQRYKTGEVFTGVLIVSCWIGFIIPMILFTWFGKDITKMTEHALMIWTLMVVFWIWDQRGRLSSYLSGLAVISLILMVFGGMVNTGITFASARTDIISDFLDGLDSRVAKETWNKLPPDALIFDPDGWRATALTGRFTKASPGGMHARTPEWQRLYDSGMLSDFVSSGFNYIYMDEKWWKSLPAERRQDFSDKCITEVSGYNQDGNKKFRRLLDISNCK